MNNWLQHLLRCPFCGGKLSVGLNLASTSTELEYGLLECDLCKSEFAVIEGVPILIAADERLELSSEVKEDRLPKGPWVSDVIASIKAKDRIKALSLMLDPISAKGTRWTFPLTPPDNRMSLGSSRESASSSAPPQGRRRLELLRSAYRELRRLYRRLILPRWRRRLAEYLTRYRDVLSAWDVITLYYDTYSNHDSYATYFTYRLGQPRHLAALSVASLLRPLPGPLLDVACGVGHLSHYFSYGRPQASVIGLDRSFVATFIAKKFVAPQAQFVCARADAALPFSTGTFEGIFCSDAFHYFRFKDLGAREFIRTLTSNGTMVLTRFGNRSVDPNEGYELDVVGYRRLFSDIPHVVRSEAELRARYLQKLGPDLSAEGHAGKVEDEKWLTLIASRDPNVFRAHGALEDWPHAVGRLGINPIFSETGDDGSARTFRFEFPSDWYAYEDAAYREYAPDTCRVPNACLEQLRAGERSVEMEEHLQRMEVVGMPDHYLVPRSTFDPTRGARS